MSLWVEGPDGCVSSAMLQGPAEPVEATFARLDDELWLATFEGLSPDTPYSYDVVDGSGHEHVGQFRTLPLTSGIVELAFGADIHPWSKPYVAFERIREAAPHVFVGLGDQIYSDIDPVAPTPPTLEGYVAAYREIWDDPSLRACWGSVPAVMVWDDHEIWNDYDGSARENRFAPARGAYQRFQRSRQASERPWTVLRAGPAEVFLLDTRTYRDPNAAPDGPDKTMLGAEQLAALVQWLETSSAKLRIVGSPTPVNSYATTGHDAWAYGFATERARVLGAIEQRDPASVVIVSGDQHWPGVFRLALPGGGSVLELMATPTAAFTRPPPIAFGADALYVGTDHVGFGMLVVDGRQAPAKAHYRWVDASGETRFSIGIL